MRRWPTRQQMLDLEKKTGLYYWTSGDSRGHAVHYMTSVDPSWWDLFVREETTGEVCMWDIVVERLDDGSVVPPELPCAKCSRPAGIFDPDPCLGWKCGVGGGACCGHGVIKDAYVSTSDGKIFRGQRAIKWLERAATMSQDEIDAERHRRFVQINHPGMPRNNTNYPLWSSR